MNKPIQRRLLSDHEAVSSNDHGPAAFPWHLFVDEHLSKYWERNPIIFDFLFFLESLALAHCFQPTQFHISLNLLNCVGFYGLT